MSYQHRQRTIQFSLIIFCCLFVAVTRAEVSVNCQGCTCIVGNLAPPPKSSWYANQQVAVRIDDAWTDVERAYFQEGIEKWNQANNCSGVLFHDFRPIHFTAFWGIVIGPLMDLRQASLYVKTGTHVLFRGVAAYVLIPP